MPLMLVSCFLISVSFNFGNSSKSTSPLIIAVDNARRYFAFCQRFETKIWIWDLTNNNLFYKNTKKLGFATNIKWSENGNYLIVYSVTNFGPGRIKVWDKFSWSSRDIVL